MRRCLAALLASGCALGPPPLTLPTPGEGWSRSSLDDVLAPPCDQGECLPSCRVDIERRVDGLRESTTTVWVEEGRRLTLTRDRWGAVQARGEVDVDGERLDVTLLGDELLEMDALLPILGRPHTSPVPDGARLERLYRRRDGDEELLWRESGGRVPTFRAVRREAARGDVQRATIQGPEQTAESWANQVGATRRAMVRSRGQSGPWVLESNERRDAQGRVLEERERRAPSSRGEERWTFSYDASGHVVREVRTGPLGPVRDRDPVLFEVRRTRGGRCISHEIWGRRSSRRVPCDAPTPPRRLWLTLEERADGRVVALRSSYDLAASATYAPDGVLRSEVVVSRTRRSELWWQRDAGRRPTRLVRIHHEGEPGGPLRPARHTEIRWTYRDCPPGPVDVPPEPEAASVLDRPVASYFTR